MTVLGDYYKKSVQAQIPVAVHFDLTYRCHQNCLHCYLPAALRRPHGASAELTTPQVKTILDQLAAAGVFFLTFSGGEVFLRPDLLDIVAYARQQNFAVSLMTSGVRTGDPSLIRHLKELGVVNIYLSLYSLNHAVHDHLTQTPGSWAAVWNTLENCRNLDLPIVFNTITLAPNYDDIWGLAEFVVREKLSLRWNYDLAPRWDGKPHLPEILLTREQEQILDRDFRDGDALSKAYENLGLSPDLQGCAAGLSHCYLNPQAKVWPCLEVKWHCGDLRGDTDFGHIWKNSAILKKVRFLQRELEHTDKRLCQVCQTSE